MKELAIANMPPSISSGGKPPYPLAAGGINPPSATLRAPRLGMAFEQRQLEIATRH